MKSIKKTIPLLLVSPLVMGAYLKPLYIYIESGVISCPTAEENQIVTMTFVPTVEKKSTLTISVYNNKTNALTYEENYWVVASSSNNTSVDVLIPFKNRINGDGLKIEYKYKQGRDTFSASGVLYPYIKQTINANLYRHETCILSNVLIKFINESVLTDETFNFNDLNEYLSLSVGNVLDLNNISFSIDEMIGFTAGKISLCIKDYGNIFPLIDKEDNLAIFDMKYEVIGSDVILSLNEQLYVNNRTLEISRNNLADCSATNNIYIPIGKEVKFEEDEIYIYITDGGYSKSDIIIPFSYFFTNHGIGQCYESDYCISGGIRE